jgi:hypothetical protein
VGARKISRQPLTPDASPFSQKEAVKTASFAKWSEYRDKTGHTDKIQRLFFYP